MNWIDQVERKMNRFGIPNLMFLIVVGMFSVFIIDLLLPQLQLSGWISFSRAAILQGQVWRLISFVFLPTSNSMIWILFSLYFYYLIGSTLENQWGSCRFTIYYLIGVLGTIVGGFLTGYATNSYLNLSLFFAFAILYPNYQIMLFFFLPVKIKYLAFADALLFVIAFIGGSLSIKASILFAILNFLLFFGGDFFSSIKNQRKYRQNQREFREYMDQNRWR